MSFTDRSFADRSFAERWHAFDASRWVHRLLVLQTIALGWTTAQLLLIGFSTGRFAPALLAALGPGVLTALSGWFAGAWSRERPWTWWALLVLQCAGVLIAPGTVRVVGAVVGLVLLLHPDSRARIDRGVPPPERTVR